MSPMSLTKKEINWLTRQARKLKLLWELLNNPNCLEVMKGLLKAVSELNNCELRTELVGSNKWTVLGCDDYTVGVSELLTPKQYYTNWLAETGAFGVGVSISFAVTASFCYVRLFKHSAPKVKVADQYLFYIDDVSLYRIESAEGYKSWYLHFILSRSKEESEFPPEIYAYFDGNLNFYHIGKFYAYEEPVEPEEIIKEIIEDKETRKKIEEAVNEAVTRIGKMYVPYLLY
jgi:hypothetical protein